MITEGSAEFYINSKCYSVKKGDILIVPPYAFHRGNTTENTVNSYDCICFDLCLLCDESLKNGLESQALSINSVIFESSPYSEQFANIYKKCSYCLQERRNRVGA